MRSMLGTLLMLLLVASCSVVPTDKPFAVRKLAGGGVELELHYANAASVAAFIEWRGGRVMLDMTESLRLQGQTMCDKLAAQPPDIGQARFAGLYSTPHEDVFREDVFMPLCIFDGIRPSAMLDGMAAGLAPYGMWYVALHDPDQRRVVFRIDPPSTPRPSPRAARLAVAQSPSIPRWLQ